MAIKTLRSHKELESAIGTSLMGHMESPYHKIANVLGDPSDSGDEYKIDARWVIGFEDGTIATIYNWKNGHNYCGEEEGLPIGSITFWHIGGNDPKVVAMVMDTLGVSSSSVGRLE